MKIIVTENQERLDKYLANNTEHSRSTIIKMLEKLKGKSTQRVVFNLKYNSYDSLN